MPMGKKGREKAALGGGQRRSPSLGPEAVAAATPKMKGGKGKKGKKIVRQRGRCSPRRRPRPRRRYATPKPGQSRKKAKRPPYSEGVEALTNGKRGAEERPARTAANLQPFMGGEDHPAGEGKKSHKDKADSGVTGGYTAPAGKDGSRGPPDRPRGGSAGFEDRGVPAERKTACSPRAKGRKKGAKETRKK